MATDEQQHEAEHAQAPPWVPRTCVWELTLACNAKCLHCGSTAGTARADELDTAEGLSLIEQLSALECTSVTLSGGEPLLRQDWPTLARSIHGSGMQLELITNGLLVEKQAEVIAAAGFFGVTFSIDGPAAVHDELRGVPGGLDQTLAGAAELVKRDVRIGAVTQVNRRNLPHLAEIHDLLFTHGFDGWQVQLTMAHGRAGEQDDLCLEPAQLPLLQETLVKLREQQALFMQVADNIGYMSRSEPALRTGIGQRARFWTGCGAGLSVIGITSDGTVRGCLSLPPTADEGNLRERNLAAIWQDPEAFAYNRRFQVDWLTGPCAGCPFGKLCRGGCTSQALAATDNPHDNPYCLWRVTQEAGTGRSPFGLPVPVRTPTIDQLAAEGTRFERVITAAPWTVPSVAAMLTGIYAHRLGLAKWEQPWPADHDNLFHRAKAGGYEVASFVFDPRYLLRRVPEAQVKGSSQDTAAVLEWLRAHRGKQFVLFIHYWWTHIPYVAKPMNTAAWKQVSDTVLSALRAGPAARAGVHRLYGHAVEHFSEQWLPQVLDALDLDDCWVALTADHGDCWGERGLPSQIKNVFDLHGSTLFDEVLRVPLILRPPGGGAGQVIKPLVRTVDLMPTLTDLLDCRPSPATDSPDEVVDGVSLAACVREGFDPPELCAVSVKNRDFVEQPRLPTDPQDLYDGIALTTTGRKQIVEPGTGRRKAYDLGIDPGELGDISSEDQSGELQAGWQRLSDEMERARVGLWLEQDAEQLRDRLRLLGYLE